jgi:hypothetical protein
MDRVSALSIVHHPIDSYRSHHQCQHRERRQDRRAENVAAPPIPIHDPTYEWWEYACHEGNTIVPNYVTTSRFERANPQQEMAIPIQVESDIANALAGHWVGRPRIATIDYDIEIAFTKNADGAVVGKLIGTTPPKETQIDKPLRRFTVKDRRLDWEFPNTQSWNFAGELSADGTTIKGVTGSIQGGIPVEFRKR